MTLKRDVWLGVGLIFLGIGFAGDHVGWWPVEFFLDAWWVMIIIIPCIINSWEQGFHRVNVIWLGLSLGLLGAQWVPVFRDFLVAYAFVVLGFAFLVVPPNNQR